MNNKALWIIFSVIPLLLFLVIPSFGEMGNNLEKDAADAEIGVLMQQQDGGNDRSDDTKQLEDASIVVYHNGDRTVLDKASPHFAEVQRACEELLRHSFLEFPAPPAIVQQFDRASAVGENYAIEITYTRRYPARAKLGFLHQLTALYRLHRFVIPLTGPLTQVEGERGAYTVIFPVHRYFIDGEPVWVDWDTSRLGLPATRRSVGELVKALRKCGVKVPDSKPEP